MQSLPNIYISVMSDEIIEAVVKTNFGFVATHHQVGSDGYVCSSDKLITYDKVCERDHGGSIVQDYLDDAEAGYDILHVDPWAGSDMDTAIDKTIEIIEAVYARYPYTMFEVGTEEKVYPYSADELEYILFIIMKSLPKKISQRIAFAVIQSGAYIFNCSNIDFDPVKLDKMVTVCNKFHVTPKEHNCDGASVEAMRTRLSKGVSYNIGPEIVWRQNKIIIDQMTPVLRDRVNKYCHGRNEWQRWTDQESMITRCTLHYYYKELKMILPKIDMTPILREVVVQ